MRTVYLIAPFCICRAGARGVSFEDDGAMKDISAEGEVEMILRIIGEAERLKRRKGVDGRRDVSRWVWCGCDRTGCRGGRSR